MISFCNVCVINDHKVRLSFHHEPPYRGLNDLCLQYKHRQRKGKVLFLFIEQNIQVYFHNLYTYRAGEGLPPASSTRAQEKEWTIPPRQQQQRLQDTRLLTSSPRVHPEETHFGCLRLRSCHDWVKNCALTWTE